MCIDYGLKIQGRLVYTGNSIKFSYVNLIYDFSSFNTLGLSCNI